MKVSVIVPNYNHAPYLRQRIESILNQSFQDFELILMDDNSTDGSREIIEAYRDNPHVSQIVYNDHNSGSAFRQWKKGIDLAHGEWIWIAESDDVAEPEYLQTMLAEATAHPRCGLLFSHPRYVYPDGHTWHGEDNGMALEFSGREFAVSRLVLANAIHNVSSTLLKRSEVLAAGLDESQTMALCGDWMLYSRMCKNTSILQVNRVLSDYRIHDANVSTRAEKQGLPFIEGSKVLDFLVETFRIPARRYARYWGREWAKQERTQRYDANTHKAIRKALRQHPAISWWYTLYKFRPCPK